LTCQIWFVPIHKDHGKLVNSSADCYKYYLADVEGFKNMTVVIPDIGGQTNDYLVLKSWEDWKEVFTKWLLDGDKGKIYDEEDDNDEETKDVQDLLGDNWDDAESEVTDNMEEVTDDVDDNESTDKEED
jgi:hypothetical protein